LSEILCTQILYCPAQLYFVKSKGFQVIARLSFSLHKILSQKDITKEWVEVSEYEVKPDANYAKI